MLGRPLQFVVFPQVLFIQLRRLARCHESLQESLQLFPYATSPQNWDRSKTGVEMHSLSFKAHLMLVELVSVAFKGEKQSLPVTQLG